MKSRSRQDRLFTAAESRQAITPAGSSTRVGNMVAQEPDLPIHLGSMPDAVRAVIAAFPRVEAGDVFIHNDPYHGGSHLPDVNVIAPCFFGELLLGFGCVRAHWPDIGSATPGSYGAVTEIYGEGLRLPPVRLYRDGEPDPDIEAIIFANVRTPDAARGPPARPGRRQPPRPGPSRRARRTLRRRRTLRDHGRGARLFRDA